MKGELAIGLALRRFRRLNMIKQGAVAEWLGVSQGCVSKWESGTHRPDSAQEERIVGLISASLGNDQDAALKRLVETSERPVHLVCDSTHRLLAAGTIVPIEVSSCAPARPTGRCCRCRPASCSGKRCRSPMAASAV